MNYRRPPVSDPELEMAQKMASAYGVQPTPAEPSVRRTEVVPDSSAPQPKTMPATPKTQSESVEMPNVAISPLWLTTSIAFSVSLVLELVASQLQLQFLAQLPGFVAAIAALSLGMVARQQPRPRDAVFYEMAIAIAAAPVLPKMLFLLLSLI